MRQDDTIPEFSLFGGPLHRLGRRLGLVRGTNTFRLGLAIGLLTWAILVLLALLQGTGRQIFSLAVVGGHVRLLLAIPLFFLCETWVAPMMAEFVRNIVRSELVPDTQLPALTSAIRRIGRMKDSWLAEVLFLVAAFALPVLEMVVNMPGSSGNWTSILGHADGRITLVNGWYLWFCLTLFRFLMFRWIWHLGLWCYFLWCVQRLDLHLIPTHSDGASGLGYLEVVHEHFTPLMVAISSVLGASFAEEVSSGTMAFETLYGMIPAVLLLNALLFIAPLFIFSRKLWLCRVTGLDEYMAMAARYAHAFDYKWLRDQATSGESQLGTGDIQSLADLTNSVNIVRNMRFVPVSKRFLLMLAASTIAPMLPLVLFKYPIVELVEKLLTTFTGL